MTTNNSINCNSVASVNGQTISASTAGGYSLATIPGNNMLINGDMQVWQRGAGGAATFTINNATQYTADRWQGSFLGSANTVFSQVAGATSGSWLAQVQRSSGVTLTNQPQLVQSCTRDMCIGAAGNVVTLSFKAKCGANYSAASSALTVLLYSGTGTTDISGLNGAFTGSSQALNTSCTLTTTLTNFSFTSSALGSTVTQLAVALNYTPVGTAGANDWFQVTDVQLEISPVQTPFQRRSFGDQLRLCKRFYQKTFDYAVLPATNISSDVGSVCAVGSVVNLAIVANWTLDNSLRTNAATITTYSPNAASANWSTNTTTPTAVVSQNSATNVVISGTTSVTAGNLYYIHATAENDVV